MKRYVSILVFILYSGNAFAVPVAPTEKTKTAFESIVGDSAQRALNNVKTSAQDVVRQIKRKTGGDVTQANAAIKDLLNQLQEAVTTA